MKKQHYIIACIVIIVIAIGISWAIGLSKLSQSEKLEKDIKANEDSLQKIKAERAVDNATPIPFSGSERQRILDSIKRVYGFDLEIQDDKGAGKAN